MCKVYVLAEKLMDDITKSYIFERMEYLSEDYAAAEDCPSLEAVRVIYNGTPGGDKLRDLFRRIYSNLGNSNLFADRSEDDDNTAQVPLGFLLDLTKSLYHRPTTDEHTQLFESEKSLANQQRDLTTQVKQLTKNYKETQKKLNDKINEFNTMKKDRDVCAKDRDRYDEWWHDECKDHAKKDRIIEQGKLDLEKARGQANSYKDIVDRWAQRRH